MGSLQGKKRRRAMNFILSALLILVITVLGLPSLGLTTPILYEASLNGASESPPNLSPGTGSAEVFFDPAAHTLQVHMIFPGLLSNASAAHIHAVTGTPGTGTVGVAIPLTGFPLGTTSGTYDHLFLTEDPSIYTTAFLALYGGTAAGAELALAGALAEVRAYVNIHTPVNPGGEIRGFLVAPAPATMLLFGTGLAGLAGTRLRRKKQ
jgi:hypothetical protein